MIEGVKKEVVEMVDKIIDLARQNLENDGELVPVFFLGTGKGVVVLATPFDSDMGKDVVAHSVREYTKRVPTDWLLQITEAYMLKLDKDDATAMNGRVSEHPNRVECVLFNFQVKGGKSYMASVETILYPSGKKSFGKVELEESNFDGRFEGLIA